MRHDLRDVMTHSRHRAILGGLVARRITIDLVISQNMIMSDYGVIAAARMGSRDMNKLSEVLRLRSQAGIPR